MVAIGSLRYMAIQNSHAAVLVIKLLVIIRATVSLQWPFFAEGFRPTALYE